MPTDPLNDADIAKAKHWLEDALFLCEGEMNWEGPIPDPYYRLRRAVIEIKAGRTFIPAAIARIEADGEELRRLNERIAEMERASEMMWRSF